MSVVPLKIGNNNCKPGETYRKTPSICKIPTLYRANFAEDRHQHSRGGLSEIEDARKNRAAEFGIFVYSARTFPAGNSCLSGVGNDLFTYWDETDPSSDIIMESAVMIARALCTMESGRAEDMQIDFGEINCSIRDIEKQVKFMDEIIKSAQTVINSGEKIQNKSRSIKTTLMNQLQNLDELMAGLPSRLSTNEGQVSEMEDLPF